MSVAFLDTRSRVLGPSRRVPDLHSFGASGWRQDGRRFVAGFSTGIVRVFDPGDGSQVVARRVDPGVVTQTQYTADGSQIVVSSSSGAVLTLDATTLRPTAPPIHFREPVLEAFPNPRGGHTAFVILGGPAARWFEDFEATDWALVDLEKGVVIRRGDLGIDSAEYGAFSPDGIHAVAGGRQSQFVVIDTRTGKATVGPTERLRGHIFELVYNADGSRLVTTSDDATARLFDARTGAQLGSVRMAHIPWAEFGPDGSVLIAVAGDGSLHRWDPSASAAVAFACRAAGRDLSRAEWQAAFGSRLYVDPCPSG